MQETYRTDISREALSIEKEYNRVKLIFEAAEGVFKVDFRFEMRYLHGDAPAPSYPLASAIEKAAEKSETEMDSGGFKKIRNELAKIYHPDTSTEDEVETFKEIQEAYEDGNYSKLLDLAVENEVKINLTPSDVVRLKEIIESQKLFIEEKTSSLEWAWFHCARTNDFRKQAWPYMKIDGDNFLGWLSEIKASLRVIEAECVARKSVEKSPAADIKVSKKWNREKSSIQPRLLS